MHFSRPDWKDPATFLGFPRELWYCIIDVLSYDGITSFALCNRELYVSPILAMSLRVLPERICLIKQPFQYVARRNFLELLERDIFDQ